MASLWDEFLNNFNSVVRENTPSIDLLWNEVGLDDDARRQAMDGMSDFAAAFIKRFIRDEKKRRDILLAEVEKLGCEYLTLKNDLHCDLPEPSENYSILQLIDFLKAHKEMLEKLKHKRLAAFDDLKKQDEKVSQKLGCSTKVLTFSTAPSEEQLLNYKDYIATQRNEVTKRENVIEEARPVIVSMINELDYTLETEFEHNVVFSNNFQLSDKNMQNVRMFKERLGERVDKNKQDVAKLRAQLGNLWNFLQISPDEQESFLSKFSGSRPYVVIEMLKKEISRCRELKLSNIERYISNLREEITKLWDLLFYREEDKLAFAAYRSDSFNEELLTIHERELGSLKERYESGKEIYVAFKHRLELWDKMKALESKGNDPKRFNNRGGKLLAEEKERAKLISHIPKLEQKLIEMVGAWETTNEQPFLVFGQSIPDYMREHWEKREQEKENEKLERRAKNHQVIEDMLMGNKTASCKRPREPTGTPLRPGNSKMAKTNLLTPINTLTNIQISTVGKPPISAVKVLPPSSDARQRKRQPSRRLFAKKGMKAKLGEAGQACTSRQQSDETNPFSVSIESTSSEFQRNLRSRVRQDKYCRSSAAPTATPNRTPNTPNGYRNRLGLPFIV